MNRDPRNVLVKPLMTEKSMQRKEELNAITFQVSVDANKVEIRQAVEKIFKVKVLRVNTLRVQQKVRRRGYAAGLTPAWKKAMVVLKEGDTIEVI